MYYESRACARSLFSILPPAETIIIILIGILMALYSMTTDSNSFTRDSEGLLYGTSSNGYNSYLKITRRIQQVPPVRKERQTTRLNALLFSNRVWYL